VEYKDDLIRFLATHPAAGVLTLRFLILISTQGAHPCVFLSQEDL
jgi:hypothetical protein